MNIENINNDNNDSSLNSINSKSDKYIENKKDELLKIRNYYKTLNRDYKKFIKKINYLNNNEISFDTTVKSIKSIKSVKEINIEDIKQNLYKNIKQIKKILYYIFENFNNKILILDGENILKSYKYQELIKKHLTTEEIFFYFSNWNNGNDDGTIQPLTSLNLSINEKLYLINIIIKNYLDEYNCIILLSGKTKIETNNEPIFINQKKSLMIPIIYNKEDIREQDDHLLLYIYYHFNKIKECIIISEDKFKWFNYKNDYLKNFGLKYNFDEKKTSIYISNNCKNDIVIYNKIKYQLGYYYFPFIKNIDIVNEFDLSLIEFEDKIIELINNNLELLLILITKILLILIELNSEYEKNETIIKKYSNIMTFLIKKIIDIYINDLDEILIIINRLLAINKKVFDKTEQYENNIMHKIFYETDNDLTSLTSLTTNKNEYIIEIEKLNKLKKNINNYVSITKIYLILKTTSFLLVGNKPIIKISKLFSYIIKIYDIIEISIYKLRKISNNKTEINKIFLDILSHHIFMKKNGFCKKDY